MPRCWCIILLFTLTTTSLPARKHKTLPSDSLLSSTLPAPSKPKGLRGFLQSITEVDTNYIAPNRYHACAMLLGEKRYSFYSLSARDADGNKQELRFSPDTPFRVGPYVGFSLLFLGYTFNMGARGSSLDRSSLYLSLYSQFIGVDFYYEADANNYRLKSAKGFGDSNANNIRNVSFSGMSTYFMNLHVYYLFNNKHFSYPAAYSQSTVQKRSTGGFILGFNYTHENVKFDYTKLPSSLLYDEKGNPLMLDALKVGTVHYRDYSISAGYGYNWVFGKNFLANFTFSPTCGYNFSKGEKFNATEKLFDLDALNLDFITRASVVWNNSRYFAGVSFVSHTYSYKKPMFSIRNSLITTSFYAGFNFLKKKKYKECTQKTLQSNTIR